MQDRQTKIFHALNQIIKAKFHFQVAFKLLTRYGFPVASEAMQSCKSQCSTQK